MKHVKEAMKQELSELKKAGDVLSYSYDKCADVGPRQDLSDEELESFEALTGRFARLSDIIIQKVFRYFDVLELEETGTIRDRINRAEKKGVIDSAEQFIQIRMLRNEIAHEYKSEAIFAIFESVLKLTPVLLDSIENIVAYANKFADDKKDCNRVLRPDGSNT